MTELNDAMVEAAAKVLCCGSVCNASGNPGDQCTASKFFGEKAHQAITAALALMPEAERSHDEGWFLPRAALNEAQIETPIMELTPHAERAATAHRNAALGHRANLAGG